MATPDERPGTGPDHLDPTGSTATETDPPHATGGAPDEPAPQPPGDVEPAPKPRSRTRRPRFVLRQRPLTAAAGTLILR